VKSFGGYGDWAPKGSVLKLLVKARRIEVTEAGVARGGPTRRRWLLNGKAGDALTAKATPRAVRA
jgi:hypothetical protein